ncbi:flagellar protein d/e [Halogeometricum borinquense DSM 11551]|uniref:Flagellar protein d/e n=1 Tax=Halogeometricum borinquense (strain ATCC 700274 / DSM 11551 / JCM 10706 / KCTC 4070 / PR3) TaxID=469382 RepID=E4NP63_HALBP|nr:FlaD/FlaE family flagellar protein [Halogeometricum borinquense]ADQ67604.1 putative archaeal flagellar protein D/E [Halogeometricum borinquense DSM 11551]ELY23715.1 flagellar protein d/e [Halogeometricum borinquense DSM 11551]
MKIDPDNYDLRELRRIADERRTDRGGSDDTERRRDYDDGHRGHDDGHRGHDDGHRGHDDGHREYDDGHRSHDDDHRGRDGGHRSHDDGRRGRDDGRRSRDGSDRGDRNGRDNRGERRGRSRREDNLRRPREGYSDHAEAHDEVVRADQIANRFGLGGNGTGGSDGRGRGYDELGYERSREDRSYDGYDFEEVGEFRFDNPVHDRPRGRAGEALRNNQLEQLLIHETAAAGGSLEKPYLSSVPKEYAAERVVFDWLEFLVLKGGFKRTMDALRYYHSVDWITEDVETELHDYLIGFSGNVSDTTEFDVDDHHLSLLYVAQLASMADGVETKARSPSALR